MSPNMSTVDRGLRGFVVAPAAILIAVLAGPGTVGAIVLFALAAVMLATAAVGFCPLYRLLHIDSRGRTPLPH